MARILLVDDDVQGLEATRKILELSGHETVTAGDGQAALDQVRGARDQRPFDLVLTDVRMPKLGGLEFLRALSLCGETMPVILMTAFGRVEDAVWAMKFGAVDFLTKPFKRQALLSAVDSALKRARGEGRSAPVAAITAGGIIGSSTPIRELRAVIAQIAPTAATVLLRGESGTGKELVARCLHQQSARASGKFIALNCAAVPEQLIESELFGFEKGAFTGATTAKEGLLEAAHGGTLLLDEIGDMPFHLQAKLLRALQEGEIRRLGATHSKKIDVRIIAATHRDLKDGVREGTFREDLLYRLAVIEVVVPALRERIEDIPDLAYHFLKQASGRHGKSLMGIDEGALEVLLAHSWPGNVRELSNVIERAVVFASSECIGVSDLPPHLLSLSSGPKPLVGRIEIPLGTSLKDVEEILIRKTLAATDGDKNMTAKLLGINSRTIYRKLTDRNSQNTGSATDKPAEPVEN